MSQPLPAGDREEAPHGHRPHLPAWLRPGPGEHRLPVAVAILVAIGLQLFTPPDLAFHPRWLLPAIETALLLGLIAANPFRINWETRALRAASVGLVAVATLAVVWSTGRLVAVLTTGGGTHRAGEVLVSGGVIWLTNLLVFALWYWELDRGGPAARANARRQHPDFLFPQMTASGVAPGGWRPTFVDYLYLAFTNSSAFSPTDTVPLARWAKLAMMVQASVSLLIVVLVIARAVNVLG